LKVKQALKSGITEITRDSCLLSVGFNSERKRERKTERKKERKKKGRKKRRIKIQNK
jgi:hypothetical protein